MKLENDGFLADLYRWFGAYKEYIVTIGYSNNTIALYTSIINQFIEFSRQYQDNMSIKEINAFYITSFLTYMENRALIESRKKLKHNRVSKNTKRVYLKALKSFLTFIGDNNDDLVTFDQIFEKVKINERYVRDKVDYLSEEEVDSLLHVLEEEKNRFGRYDNYRNSLLIKLMLYGGFRISEALRVKLEDFDLMEEDIYRVKIIGKGGQQEYGYIGARIIKDEIFYFQTRINHQNLIMVTASQRRLSRQNAFVIVNRLYKKAGINKQGLHILRHTFAMKLAKKGVDVLVIKRALRHKVISSTLIYAKAEEDQLVQVLK